MNLVTNNEEIKIEELQKGNQCIAFFVHKNKFYWICDWKDSYQLNAELDFEAYVAKGTYSKEKVDGIKKNFRNGISQMDQSNFELYLALPDTQILSADRLRNILYTQYGSSFCEIAQFMDDFISFGVELNHEQETLRAELNALLPKFYINFDRKRYFHMDWGRMHDEYCYDGWVSSDCDFEILIPHSQKYWLFENGRTLWTVTNIRWN